MVLILESRTHLDLGDLPNLLAAELGVMTVRLERAIRSLDGVARVHVNRWGDGSAHLHMWFLARPYGLLQLRGTFLSLWDSILPPISEAQWRENLALVAAWLAEFGGRPLAEPPRIQWQAPSSLLAQSAAADAAAAAEAASAAAAGTESVSVIEAAEEIPEPALDSTPDPTDADSGPSADPVVDPDADADSTTTTVTDRTAGPARAGTATGPTAEPARTASATDRPGTRDSTTAGSGGATTTATDGLHVSPAGDSADEAPANPAASEPANGEAVSKATPENGVGGTGGQSPAAPANGSDTPDVRATH
ncbi:hypothetical protein NIE79_005339 [Micromonospora sp. NIE79]|uniref:Uncharacterized protein n=1 Tax=Micromonospora trifolii TaxID=2911208 RepID=A0ABS9NBM1_9ACTN|nr:hypothetical protein [Micromonospora trifolii]